MARQLTPPVTVVKGDEAPDVYINLQQDSTGTPYVLTNRAAFAVIVESGAAPEEYIEKFEVEITDELTGQLKLSWVKDPVERTSYLDNLLPSKRYLIQLFLGSVNYPPLSITCEGSPDVAEAEDIGKYVSGIFEYTGEDQEGSPVYKFITTYGDEVYLSRSPHTDGNPGDFVWVVTAFAAEVWDIVKEQDKATLGVTGPNSLEDTPIWNFYQVIPAAEASDYSLAPKLNEAFTTAPDYVIAPAYAGGKGITAGQTFTATSTDDADVESSGTQTVLTLIPLVVKEAYRLSDAD